MAGFQDSKDETFPEASHVQSIDGLPEDGKVKGETATVDVGATSVALAEAMEKDKPRLFSKNMLKLWWIMSIGYLISTMNGFGKLVKEGCKVLRLTIRNRQFTHGCHQRYEALSGVIWTQRRRL